MANKFYQMGGQRGAKVADLFAAIAPRYDLINDLQSFGMHRLWKRRLVRLSGAKPGQRALDMCCGTGDIAFALAARGAEVDGLDFSAAMLEVARKRAATLAQSPSFQQGDAQNLPFADNAFDIVTVGYGLRNLPEWDRGLRQMWRVAKPGGRLLVLDFGKPDFAPWRAVYFAYLKWFVPMFGKLFCGDPATHAYILESLKAYPAQRGVEAKMRELGCRDVRVYNLIGGAMSIHCGSKS